MWDLLWQVSLCVWFLFSGYFSGGILLWLVLSGPVFFFKHATLHVQHTFFLYISLPLFCTTTTWNFQKLLSYTFYGGNVVSVSVHFFSLPLIFTLHWWLLAFLILSPPLQNFHVVLPTKKCLLCFLSLALNPCRPFSRWASLACFAGLSLFLSLSLALYYKLVDMTIYVSLIL